VSLKLARVEPLLYHNEPIWRDGRIVGRVTSGMFGHTIGRPLALGYVANAEAATTPEWINSGHYEIEIAAQRHPAEVLLQAFYDPASRRVRG